VPTCAVKRNVPNSNPGAPGAGGARPGQAPREVRLQIVAVALKAHSWAFAPRRRGLDPPFDGGVTGRHLPFPFSFPLRPAASGAEGKRKNETCSDATPNRGYKPRSTRRSRGAKAAEAASRRPRATIFPFELLTAYLCARSLPACGGRSLR
jgi:hypothetical protein